MNIMKNCLLIATSMVLLGSSCSFNKPEPWDGAVLTEPRTQLTIDQLNRGDILPLLDMSFFAKPEWAEDATHVFSGSLTFMESQMKMELEREIRQVENQFPAFTIDFVAEGEVLIPRQREIISARADILGWDVIVGTGRTWNEKNDKGWTRASFPLSLTDRYIGSVRNCVVTFAYAENMTSNAYVQCSQETADINDKQIYDIRVAVPVKYKPKHFEDEKLIVNAHKSLVSKRIATQPLDKIDADGAIADYFNKSIWSNASTSVGAIYLNGILYVNPPNTRHGTYPYPDEMRHGVYSVTKSLVGALSMFYFAERYGPEIFDEKITKYVPALSNHPEWAGVTFAHALNMVTGTRGGEEYDLLFYPVMSVTTAEQAINNIAQFGDGRGEPGQIYNYATTNFFVLSYALQSYVKQQEDKDVRFWDLVRDNVLKPIGVENFDVLHTKEHDLLERIPTLGYGARPTLDDAAKITRLIANEGEYKGLKLLNREKIREALGRTDWLGFRIDRSKRYRHSFWSQTYKTTKCDVQVSYMQGFGSNHIIILPSGVLIFRFMDEFDTDFTPLLEAAESLKSSC